MKKSNNIIIYLSILINSAASGLGMTCLLNLIGIALGIAIDGRVVIREYPRFIPFCIILGMLALLILITVFIINVIVLNLKIKVTKKYVSSMIIFVLQYIISFIFSIPMLFLWQKLFTFLQNTL